MLEPDRARRRGDSAIGGCARRALVGIPSRLAPRAQRPRNARVRDALSAAAGKADTRPILAISLPSTAPTSSAARRASSAGRERPDPRPRPSQGSSSRAGPTRNRATLSAWAQDRLPNRGRDAGEEGLTLQGGHGPIGLPFSRCRRPDAGAPLRADFLPSLPSGQCSRTQAGARRVPGR